MSVDVWNGNGNWNSNPADWSADAPPTATEDAVIQVGDDALTAAGTVDYLTIITGADLTLSTATAALRVSGNINNAGGFSVDASGGDGGGKATITGKLVNSGSIVIGNDLLDASTTVAASALANSGSLALWGNEGVGATNQTTLDITGASPAAIRGEVYLHGDAMLEFGSGGIKAVAEGAELELDGSQARVSIGAATTNTGLSGLASNAGTLDFEGGSATGPGGTTVKTTVAFANGGVFEVDVLADDGASAITFGGALTNGKMGSIIIGNPFLTAPTTVTATSLVNNGSIALWGNENAATTKQTTLDITGAAPTILTGNVALHADSLLDFATGGITAIGYGAQLQINGAQARVSIGAGTTNSALNTLASNAGTIDLEGDLADEHGGTAVKTSVAFTNSGVLDVDAFGGAGASSFQVVGALTNTKMGAIVIGNTELTAASTMTATTLVNNGSITLWGDSALATLDVTGAAPTTLTGDVYLHGDALLEVGSGGVTSIGYGAELELDGSQARASVGVGATNSALSGLASNLGTLDIEGESAPGPGGSSVKTTVGFTNNGVLDIDVNGDDGGSTFAIGGVLTNATVGAIVIGNTNLSAAFPTVSDPTTVSASSLVNNGSITLWGNDVAGTIEQATLAVAGAAPGTLTGDVYLHGDSLLEFGSGGITSIGYTAQLELNGSEARASIGPGTINSALSGLASNGGLFDIEGDTGTGPGGPTVTTTVGFTNNGNLDIDSVSADGASSFKIGGAFTNTGTVVIGNGSLSASTTVTATGFFNENSITVQGNSAGATKFEALLNITSAAPTTTTGTLRIGGDAVLQFMSGGITAIGAGSSLELDGAEAQAAIAGGSINSALTELSVNMGVLTLQGASNFGAGGDRVVTKANLANSGTLSVDAYSNGDGASVLTISGTITNTGAIDIGNAYLSASTTVNSRGLVNGGSLLLQGNAANLTALQATLNVLAAAPTITTGSMRIGGDALLEYASGGITTIGAGSWFELDGVESRASIGSSKLNSALTGLTNNYGTLVLSGNSSMGYGGVVVTTTTSFTNSGVMDVDSYSGYDGGSTLTIGGTLTNSGTLNIGNGALGESMLVTASGLVNNGSITLQGNTSSATLLQATLDITAAAPSATTGYMRIGGDGVLEYKSGGIGSIGVESWFELDGAEAQATVAGGSFNSALTGLTGNQGTLALRGDSYLAAGGVTVATTTNFANSGIFYVDGYSNGDGGSTLTIGGTFTNTGTFNVGNGSLGASTLATLNGLVNNGSITLQGNEASSTELQATLDVLAAAPTTTTGYMRIGGDALLEFKSGGIATIGVGSWFELDGYEARVSIGSSALNSALTGLASNLGTLALRGDSYQGYGGDTVVTKTSFANSGLMYVDAYGNGDGGSSLTLGGTLSNSGTLDIGNSGLSNSTLVTATGFANTGSVTLQGNAASSTSIQATLDIAAAAPTTTTGYLRIGGDGVLEFKSGDIASIGADAWFELDGAEAEAEILGGGANSALSKLASNQGNLLLRGNTDLGAGGVTLATTTSFNNSGDFYVDSYSNGDGGSTLTIGGALTNSGSFSVGNGDLSLATTVSATAVNNSGLLSLLGGGSGYTQMTVAGAVANTGTVDLGAGATLSVTGAGNVYTQTAGTTTVAGTLATAVVDDGGLVDFTSALTSGGPTGALSVGLGGVMEFGAGVDSGQHFTFADTTGTLELGSPANFAGVIYGFARGDVIDLVNTPVNGLSYSGNTLTVMNSTGIVAELMFNGAYTISSFSAVSDGNGGTDILDPPSAKLLAAGRH